MKNQDFPQVDADRIYTELGTLCVDLDDDPLIYGPKRLNNKTAQVRRMLSRCESLYLDISRKLQMFRKEHRVASATLDLAKKHLFTHDPDTRSGRSQTDRDAIASGKLKDEIERVDRLGVIVADLEAVMVVIKTKRADLKDTEGRLRDQIRLCSEEIGLGSKWGSKVPDPVPVQGAHSATTSDLFAGIEAEIQLQREAGEWKDPKPLSTDFRTPQEEESVPETSSPEVEATTPAVVPLPVFEFSAPARDPIKDMTPSATAEQVDIFLNEVSLGLGSPNGDTSKLVSDVDTDTLVDFFDNI